MKRNLFCYKFISFALLVCSFFAITASAFFVVAGAEDNETSKSNSSLDELYNNDPSVPRVVDLTATLNNEEKSKLTELLAAMQQEFKMDFVVLISNGSAGKGTLDYTIEYYEDHGYGFGDDYSGVIFSMFLDPEERDYGIDGTGKADKYFTSRNVNRLLDRVKKDMVNGDYAVAIEKTFTLVRSMLKTGHVPLSGAQIAFIVIVAVVVGLIAGCISLSSAKASMRTVARATSAAEYLNPISFAVNYSKDRSINTDVSRTYIGGSSDSGSRSGGSSSYHSGYHSSSGRSYSGGRRKF